jgi:hypothetical protein
MTSGRIGTHGSHASMTLAAMCHIVATNLKNNSPGSYPEMPGDH